METLLGFFTVLLCFAVLIVMATWWNMMIDDNDELLYVTLKMMCDVLQGAESVITEVFFFCCHFLQAFYIDLMMDFETDSTVVVLFVLRTFWRWWIVSIQASIIFLHKCNISARTISVQNHQNRLTKLGTAQPQCF